MKILQTKNLTKTYPGQMQPSLREVSFDLNEGEILSLLGPSGSGKTTLLRLLAGFEKPDGGKLLLDGKELVGAKKIVPPNERPIGMVFQDFALFPHMTVSQNVGFGLSKWSKLDREKRVKDCLEMVELADFAHQTPLKLSGGQQQRVALARALAPNPRILLLDEPFSNMDAQLRQRLSGKLIVLLMDLGVTAIFVTHDTADALAFADRVGVISHGQLLQMDTPEEICAHPNQREVAQMIGKMNLVPAIRRNGVLETCFGTYYPNEKQSQRLPDLRLDPIWLGLRPQCFVPWNAGVFQGSVTKTYCTPIGREAVVDYPMGSNHPPLSLIIPIQSDTFVGEQLQFNVLLEEATIFEG